MAFALSKFRAWPANPSVPTRESGVQYAYFELTAAATDVVLDFGNSASLLWTDLVTTGAGQNALVKIQAIQNAASGVLSVEGPQLFVRTQVGTLTGAGQKLLAIVTNAPSVTVNAADGETTWAILITWRLKQGERGILADYQNG